MATQFFERQDRARHQTFWLVCWFLMGTGGVVLLTSLLVGGCFWGWQENGMEEVDRMLVLQITLLTALITTGIILLGTLFKVLMLRSGGGKAVAEGLGGTLLYPDARDPNERRLLNVVEEMAIASGVPVPPVFLMREEEGINAFAAGYSPSDAVIGVTRGAVECLSRDQLQGVIAHEFSHILNGDMRLGIRLIGVLHGILLLGLTGRLIFEVVAHGSLFGRRSSRSDSNSGGGGGGQAVLAILAVAAALVLVGAFGSFIGNLIKAAVSRQREYLADASAVQFTRNPAGLAGALKRIGAIAHGALVRSPGATESSHLFFAEGVSWGLASLMATHPPLEKRIRAIEPDWDGSFPEPESFLPHEQVAGLETAALAGFAGTPHTQRSIPRYVPVSDDTPPTDQLQHAPPQLADTDQYAAADLRASLERMGDADESHQTYARGLIESIPGTLRAAAHDPFGARAVVFALLLDEDDQTLREQVAGLETAALAGFAGTPPTHRPIPRYVPVSDDTPTTDQLQHAPTQLADTDQYAAADLRASLERMGDAGESYQTYARGLIESIPGTLRAAAHDPFGARAVVFALLLDEDDQTLREQLRALQSQIEPTVVELTADLATPCRRLDARLRLPLIDMTIPALQAMTPAQYAQFDQSFWALIHADKRINLFEWTLSQVLHRHLAARFTAVKPPRTRYYALTKLRQPISLLLSLMAHVGHDPEHSRQAFALATSLLPETELTWLPQDQCRLDALQPALDELRTVTPKLKSRLIDACLAIICADGIVRPREAELLRAIGDLLDCPVPPMLPGQRTERLLP